MNDAFYSLVDRVINLSTGALALSIAFKNSFSKEQPACLALLEISWISFAAAILAALVLLYGRVEVNRRTAQFYQTLFKMTREELLSLKDGVIIPPAKWFAVMRAIMSLSFAVGIITLAAYAILNLR